MCVRTVLFCGVFFPPIVNVPKLIKASWVYLWSGIYWNKLIRKAKIACIFVIWRELVGSERGWRGEPTSSIVCFAIWWSSFVLVYIHITFRLFFWFSPARFNPISNKLKSQQVSKLALLKNNCLKKLPVYLLLDGPRYKRGGKGKERSYFFCEKRSSHAFIHTVYLWRLCRGQLLIDGLHEPSHSIYHQSCTKWFCCCCGGTVNSTISHI